MRLLDLLLDRGAMQAPAAAVRAARVTTLVQDARPRQDPLSGRERPSAVAHRCVQAIAGNIAALDLTVIGSSGEANDAHPIAQLFNRTPNPAWSARSLKEVILARMEWRGEAFVYLDRGATGSAEPREMWPIFDPVVPVVGSLPYAGGDSADTLAGYQVRLRGGKRVGLLPSEVLWLRYPSPDTPWGAVAPWSRAEFAAELDQLLKAWQLGELRNGGRPSAVVYLGDLDEDTHKQVVAEFRARAEGPSNAGKHLFVSSQKEAKVERLGLTPAELSYLDSRRFDAEEIMLAFGVPKDYLVGGSTFDNQRAAKVNLWSDALVGKMEVVASEVDRQLLPSPADSAAFDVSGVDALNENQDAVSGRVRELMYADVMLIDEAREAMGLPPLPDGLGQQTLTAYRQQLATDAQLDLMGDGAAPAPAPGRNAWLSVGPRPRVYVTRTGIQRISLVADLHTTTRTATVTRARSPRPLSGTTVRRAYNRHQAIGARSLARLADKQRRVVLRNLERLMRKHGVAWQTRVNGEDLFDPSYWSEFTRDALEQWLAGIYDDGGSRTATALGLDFDLFDTKVTQAMHSRLHVLADQVTQTTLTILQEDVLGPGVAAGLSVDDLAARVRDRFDDLATWRAETIARTETVGGFNAAARATAVGSGVVKARRWLATLDDRTRDGHAQLDGYTTQGLDDPYPNGLLHPGDPSGPAEETVNCRCVETYVLADEED